jgi:hypothetical protein
MLSNDSSGSEFEDSFASRRSFTEPHLVTRSSGLGASLAGSATGLVRALSRGFTSTGFDDDGNHFSKAAATTRAASQSGPFSSPLHTTELDATASGGRHRTYTEQIYHAKARGRSRHLSAVLKTSLCTTAYLVALLAAVAMVHVPPQEGACLG